MKRICLPALGLTLLLGLFSACGWTDSAPDASRFEPPPPAQSRPVSGTVSTPDPPTESEPEPSSGSESEPEPASGSVSEPEPAQNPESEPGSEQDTKPEPGADQKSDPPDDPGPAPDPPNTRLYVLMYHDFIPEGKKYNQWMVTDVRLREDLQWMAEHGWTTVLPSQLVAGEPLPPKAVMLTFDDGYESNYTLAYPILQEFQAKAVISIIVQYTDDQVPYYLTWDMCQEMVQSGLVEIGSHTYAAHGDSENGIRRHKGETREEYEARILPDLQTSIDLIEENLGRAPVLFTYPNGVKDAWAAGFIQNHFPMTVTTIHGSCNIAKGLYSLRRCNVSMSVPASKLLPD